jgi:hypothetical protein
VSGEPEPTADASKGATPAAPPPPSSDAGGGLGEFFLLRASMQAARAIGDDVRTPLRQDLALARSRRLAATALLHDDPGVDAERLAAESLEAARSAVERLQGRLSPAVQVSLAQVVETARHPAQEIEFDAHDGLATTRAAQIHRLLDAEATLHAAVEPYALTTTELARQRLNRWTAVIVAMALLVVVPYYALRPPRIITATASASYSGEFPPQHVVDQQPKAEWLLPNAVVGWIDLNLSPPRPVSTLRILNAHNPPYNDRATKDFTVTTFCEGKATETVHVFPELLEKPPWMSIPLSTSGRCNRIRIGITSFHGGGGGIAEVEVD